ncbi:hypothetical protein [Yoonia sp. 2307UL14-13]|uniref:hypothetical protein n=1 Tax=Yoonia sp. 2307UL14-13 TaxID=3126506 RepID=UPI00309C4BA0
MKYIVRSRYTLEFSTQHESEQNLFAEIAENVSYLTEERGVHDRVIPPALMATKNFAVYARGMVDSGHNHVLELIELKSLHVRAVLCDAIYLFEVAGLEEYAQLVHDFQRILNENNGLDRTAFLRSGMEELDKRFDRLYDNYYMPWYLVTKVLLKRPEIEYFDSLDEGEIAERRVALATEWIEKYPDVLAHPRN